MNGEALDLQIWACEVTGAERVWGFGEPTDPKAEPMLASAGTGRIERHTYSSIRLGAWREFKQGASA